ncbi:hypothetical protein Taro_052428 [Colocasia esculenta]|uniref:Uncharacterized protein n=1 Tax=Colocasia esculenta TaxID=4460 RepID=A0A843XK14_COLES|nr:hypothetical protein [Colocasia esculenta]
MIDCLPVHAGRPDDRDYIPVHAGRLGDRDCLLVHAGRPGDRDRLLDHASSATFPFFLTTRTIQPPPSRSVHIYIFDPTPIWLRRDYWESLCEHWATGPWQEQSQAAKRNRSTHLEKNVHTSGSVSYATHSQKLHHELERAPTFRELFHQTHKRKGTDDYVSESARTIAETYDKTMADRYAEGTPQPDLDLEAWVDAAGGPRKGRVYGFGDSLDTTLVLSSYASSVAPSTNASSSTAPSGSGVEEIRTLMREGLREELRTHFGVLVE